MAISRRLAFLLLLSLKKNDPVAVAKVFFAAGAGALGFGIFRLFLFDAFRDNLVWFSSWEEALEFLTVAGIGASLWAL
ncbi:MAG: hypothetical protein NTW86_21275 [Candidatus Sumerlaeota bacterium]|nr:hypothetical protein [Candidatus Sumerlaeota bacterium]